MNPSYNNGSSSGAGGASNIPGVKPGVIASGPDPVDVPDMPSAPGASAVSSASAAPKDPPAIEIASETPSGLSLGSKHLFKKPRMSTPKRNMIISTGGGFDTGSAGLNGGPSRGPKKGLIIGGLLVVVLLIVGLVVGMNMMGNKGGNNAVSGGDKNVFNDLINYVTSGTESNADVTDEYDAANEYYFLNGRENEEQKKEIYDETKTLLDDFVNSYKDGDDGALNNLVKSTKEQFDFMYKMDLIEKNTGTKIIEDAVKNGKEKAKQNAMNYYNFSGLKDNTYVSGFLESYESWVDALLNQVDFYQANACVSDVFIMVDCISGKNDENLKNEATEISNNVADLYQNMTGYYDMARGYIANIYNINDILNGNAVVEDEDE